VKLEELYTSGVYLEKNPTWHVEESPWKVRHIIPMMKRHHLIPHTVCEVGCGAGEVLKQLQEKIDPSCSFWGYEISPQAFELSKSRANERLHFKLADFTQEQDVFFDLLLVLDVIEHLEDYFSFLRAIRPKGDYKILHIPLDLSVQTILRRNGLPKVREAYGHIHYFTKDIALQALKDVGYEVLDYCYTARAIEQSTHEIPRHLMKLPRKLLYTIHEELAARILGGWSLLVLAK
jgi:cyclopropane fatty-acyl-phospholipid synthase-like methyltransferase